MTAQMVLEFDTPEWRQVRDHKLREWVQDESALAWFLDFCHVCEIFDDMADQDKPISKADIATALFASLVEMPTNPFFTNHRQVLAGVIITGINAVVGRERVGADGICGRYEVCRDGGHHQGVLPAGLLHGAAGGDHLPDRWPRPDAEGQPRCEALLPERVLRGVRPEAGCAEGAAGRPSCGSSGVVSHEAHRTCKMSGGGGGSGGDQGASAEERALYGTQADIAREQWDEYKRLGVPIQEGLAAEASAPISESEYATNIGRAGADVDQAYDQAGTQFRSSLGRYGLNPGSGRFASGLRSLSLGRAASKAGAMTGARGALQFRRDRLRHGVLAGLQGQAGQAQQGLASAAAGYGGIAQRAQRKCAGLTAAATFFSDPRVKDACTVGKLDSGIPIHIFRYKDRQSGFGQVLGTGLTAAIPFLFSDRRVKDDMGTVGKLDSGGIPIHIFRYKDVCRPMPKRR